MLIANLLIERRDLPLEQLHHLQFPLNESAMVLGKLTRQGQLKLGPLTAQRAQGQGCECFGIAFAITSCLEHPTTPLAKEVRHRMGHFDSGVFQQFADAILHLGAILHQRHRRTGEVA